MRLRRATLADAAKLAAVGAAGFLESFADDHPGDDLIAHLEAHHTPTAYRAALNDPTLSLWIVEEALGAPVGYAMMGDSTLPFTTARDAELKRIYMLSRWHGGGWGGALLTAVVTEARARGAERLALAVYTNNPKAIAFYEAKGFQLLGPTQFQVGATVFEDLVMAKPL
ncbi:MAG: GNAT family N-acetyltransferase [Sphingomonadaceae bacterium]